MAITQIDIAPRGHKPKMAWSISAWPLRYSQVYEDGEIIATLYMPRVGVECGLIVPAGTLVKVAQDKRKQQAIARYLSVGYTSEAVHHLRHWHSASDLSYSYIVTVPQFYK